MGLVSKVFGGDKFKAAAKAQAQGYKDSIDTYRQAKDEALPLFNPYQNLGEASVRSLMDSGQGNFDAFYNSPGYQFAKEEGTKAVENSAASRGMLLSGAHLKELSRYNEGLASQRYNDWWNQNFNLANLGYNAATAKGNITLQTAGNVGAAQQGVGSARASGYVAQGGIQNGIANSFLNTALSFTPKPGGSS